ncbi:K02A2.6-like [Cordylochernes scorpioides]|uniref:K02A2.6-like n=1 Tax=Cordylochernes scorpioides TaxID=51811 RepID=A0ABY6KDP0_9ARAC|nr:K02A2.6-like [Cordylochernes scorpioides]
MPNVNLCNTPKDKLQLKIIQRLNQPRVIGQVDKPTGWFAPMVAVSKPSGGIRIGELNRNVLREIHPKPIVENFLQYQLQCSKVCNKFDDNSGTQCQVLLSLSKAGITLNRSKCLFGVKSITFPGHILLMMSEFP